MGLTPGWHECARVRICRGWLNVVAPRRIGFIAAMGSNLSSALRGILAKKTMGGGVGENMTEANLYAVLTILGGWRTPLSQAWVAHALVTGRHRPSHMRPPYVF